MTKAVFACVLLISIWCPAVRAEDVIITVRLVNGRNGKAITDENLNVFINGSAFAESFKAHQDGTFRLTVDRNATIAFASNVEATCHPYSSNERRMRWYHVSEIFDHGIADDNLCSRNVHVEAKAGEFVFYERPRTLLEWWRL